MFSVLLILHRDKGNLVPIPRSSGDKVGNTMDKVPTHHRAQSYPHYIDNFEISVSQQCMDWGGHQSTLRKPQKHRENIQTYHTQRADEQLNPQPWRSKANHQALMPSRRIVIKCHFQFKVPALTLILDDYIRAQAAQG